MQDHVLIHDLVILKNWLLLIWTLSGACHSKFLTFMTDFLASTLNMSC